MNLQRWLTGAAGALALVVAACGGGGGIGGTGSPMGTLRVSMTDAPACGYDEVNVTVEKVRVHQSSNAGENDAGWSDIVLNPPQRIDLLTLTNGALAELGQVELPAGKYTQLRLVLAANGSTLPPANSVVLTGSGTEVALNTPSAQQSGLKLNANIDVPAGQVLDVVLDFDACKSVVKAGNSGRYNLKPVIAVIPVLSDAGLRVIGYVAPALANAATAVSVQASGVPIKATIPDSTGRFELRPVPAGSYDLVVTAPTHSTAVMTAVPVVSGTPTQVSSMTVPIAPAAAASAPVAVPGSVTPATATVRALQTLTGGPTVEVGFAPVDADTGAFEFLLALAPPGKTAYVANPATITFAPDAAAAGRFTLEAESGGTLLTQPVDVNLPVPPVTFLFP
ncbi:MAG: DUF4382 domain-containing protein [Piscinibacter sp.]|nr:DUF4382 domain-containing protein [Piscinibacter sp.]